MNLIMPNSDYLPGVFSIVMPAHNAATTISKSIDSVLSQPYQHWELLVVDDASKDNTADIVRNYARTDARIKLFSPATNLRVAGARNLALENAKGQFVCFLDSDDWWAPNKLDTQAKEFKKGAKVCFSSYHRVIDDVVTSTVTTQQAIKASTFYYYNPIGNLVGAYDRSQIGTVFFETVPHEDYLMWYEVVKKAGTAIGTIEPLGYYRVSSNSLSGKKSTAAKWHWNIIRNHFKLPLPFAAFAFSVYAFISIARRAKERIR
jgi:teichuronic acid biosynthesis glycosyltransferase TuaG